MNTKIIPAVVSLLAGLVSLVVTYIRKAEMNEILTTLLVVLLSFYVLGWIVKAVIDKYTIDDKETEEAEDSELENIETEQTEQTEQV